MTRRESGLNMTLQQSQMTIFDDSETKDKLTSLQGDSHAKLFQLLGNERDLTTLEGLYSLKSHVSQISSDHNIYSLKTSKDSYHMTTEIRSRQSFERWMNSGMMRNGICLTLRTLEYPKTGKGCSLSDILEDQVHEKYFLSDQVTKRLMSYRNNQQIPSQQ